MGCTLHHRMHCTYTDTHIYLLCRCVRLNSTVHCQTALYGHKMNGTEKMQWNKRNFTCVLCSSQHMNTDEMREPASDQKRRIRCNFKLVIIYSEMVPATNFNYSHFHLLSSWRASVREPVRMMCLRQTNECANERANEPANERKNECSHYRQHLNQCLSNAIDRDLCAPVNTS